MNLVEERQALESSEFFFIQNLLLALDHHSCSELKPYQIIQKYLAKLEAIMGKEFAANVTSSFTNAFSEANHMMALELEHVRDRTAMRKKNCHQIRKSNKKIRRYWNRLATREMKVLKRVCR